MTAVRSRRMVMFVGTIRQTARPAHRSPTTVRIRLALLSSDNTRGTLHAGYYRIRRPVWIKRRGSTPPLPAYEDALLC
jgi:hypothetical protein